MTKAKKKFPKKSFKKPEFKKLSDAQVAALNFFQRRRYKHKLRLAKEAERRAKDLATLPKSPKIKRFFARLAPKRVFHFIFSWYGLKKILKFLAACILIGIIAVGGLFVYYKQQIKSIDPASINISETVNTYLDRNGVVLWEDTGSENYRLTVDGSEMPEVLRQATVSIEDKNFYNHHGMDVKALIRATISTLSGRGVQGGSTLTQQLVKQIYFSNEAASANRGGVTRKIKELILAIELEKMYNKEQILTMYLNQSPYGGRRNGVESAARTYFGKSTSELDLAESALLAAIPNNPAVLNPYNKYGNTMLINRQHKVLDDMTSMGYITKEQAQEAKEVDILARILPESTQYSDMLAPHFVLEVRSQLEEKYGISTMRQGGYTITTTLDYRAQKIAEDAVERGKQYLAKVGADNTAMVSVDVETSQVVAMVGSADFSNPTFGELNVTTDSLIEPGSTIKPILDYAPLFMKREGQNFGPGTILKDENIDAVYCGGNAGKCQMRNATGQFYGNVSIRFSLGHSLNIGAVKALYINGIDNSLEIAHALGDKSYCENRDYGLSIAIGSGCGVRLVEHANAYASLARGGSYKDLAYILEVKSPTGEILETWTDSEATQVVDPEVAYMISSILSDDSARWYHSFGFKVPGVWTTTKTGTTTDASNNAKDALMASYSTALATVAWDGNHDGKVLKRSDKDVVANIIGTYMERVHKEVYGPEGKWSSGDQPVKPAGIKTLTVNGVTDIWPSWYNEKTSGVTKTTLEFNRLNNLLAVECTDKSLRVSVEVTKTIDPMTKKEVWSVPEPYNREVEDDCSLNGYSEPSVSASEVGSGIRISLSGYGTLTYRVVVDGKVVEESTAGEATFTARYQLTGAEQSIKVTVSDSYGATASAEL